MKKIKRCTCDDIPENTIHKIAAVLVDNGKTIVVKKKGLDEYISLGGKHEGSESHGECLNREALEELGIEVSNPQFLGRYQDVTSDIGAPIILDAYITTSQGELNPQSEIENFLWVDSDWRKENIELASIIRKGIIPELIKRGLL